MVDETLNVVHETEVERQHPRVRIPATLHMETMGREKDYHVIDISAGGFAFDSLGEAFNVGKTYHATLNFAIDPMGMTLPIDFRVCNVDQGHHRVGCSFEDLDERQVALLRQLINAYIAGEVVSVGDMLTTLSRNNFAKPREPQGALASQPQHVRPRTVTLTGLLFLVGVAAFLYAFAKLYGVLFINHAIAAKVAAPSFAITMPRDGTYFNLVPPDGKVKKGQPLGTFQAAMLDVVQNDPGSLHLTPQQLSDLMGETLKGTLSSPCDCTVQQTFALDSQFINRNQPLMVLLPDDAKPYVLARFHFDNIQDLRVGRTVSFHVSGENHDRYGRISQVRLLPNPAGSDDKGGASDLRGLDAPGAVSDVLTQIEPAQPLARTLIDQPVDVQLGDPRNDIAGPLAQGVRRVRELIAGL
ncbi:PilZ domain-containing protein [Dyella sedimenti]|uniref:PilZ domain-containing protein n=1 Tax=Dyella sedimenti TaxID=2919947 RepID=UPI001FAA67D5|nr:PilZ domain-containing protein [Dyella sedimenti]